MDQMDLLHGLIDDLLTEMPTYTAEAARCPDDPAALRQLLRSLMNVRPPRPLAADFLARQDAFLSAERAQRGVVDAAALPATAADARLVLWQGDITRLATDAIVNAANSALLGCFHPCHGCIDNAIHSAAGLQLRRDCQALMTAQGHDEPAGGAKITPGYNLPARHVLHTVGPIIRTTPSPDDAATLAACYRSCLDCAAAQGLGAVAFCCISTGEYRYPNDAAAAIAIDTVRGWLDADPGRITRVIFNVFKDDDLAIYRRLLGA